MEALHKQQRLDKVMSLAMEGSAWPSEYYHWDELRFRKPPNGLTTEEWWLIVKLARTGQRQVIPLKDKSDKAFSWTPWFDLQRNLSEIDRGLGYAIETSEPIVSKAEQDRYIVRNLMEEAISSSQIEGAVTTRPVAKEMIRTGRPPRDKSEKMILNNYRTMQMIRGLRKDRLSPSLIFRIHKEITEQTLDDAGAAGRLRRPDEYIVVAEENSDTIFHEPPPAASLEERLKQMCDFANSESKEPFIHPVLRSIMLHFWLAYDHPFVDGNGRVARALFYWSMLRHGYWMCEFISISPLIYKAPADYYRAFLFTESDDNDLTYFLNHQLAVIRRAVDGLHKYLSRQADKMRLLRAKLRGMGDLNHRQIALIEHALKHRDAAYTIESHQNSHGVVYETARRDLFDLEKRGVLTSRKVGRTFRFRPAANIEFVVTGGGG